MGIVVLRSTTPCVAVSSRSNSNLLTVISMVPAATAASTGIKFVSPKLAEKLVQKPFYRVEWQAPQGPKPTWLMAPDGLAKAVSYPCLPHPKNHPAKTVLK